MPKLLQASLPRFHSRSSQVLDQTQFFLVRFGNDDVLQITYVLHLHGSVEVVSLSTPERLP